jgi:hypothetical protein
MHLLLYCSAALLLACLAHVVHDVVVQHQGTTVATTRNTMNIHIATTRNNSCNISMKQFEHHEYTIATTKKTTTKTLD